MTPREALTQVEEAGLTTPTQGDAGDCVALAPSGWQPVALALSVLLPGAFCWPTKHGVTVSRGPDVLIRMATPDFRQASQGASMLARMLIGRPVPVNAGVAARHLWEWAARPDRPNYHSDMLLLRNGKVPRYHCCLPGKGDFATLHDMKRCYPQLMGRLPSLRPRVGPKGLFFVPMKPDEAARVRDLLSALDADESLRRYAWGCALGSEPGSKIPLFVNGDKRLHSVPPGPFRTAALLVARSAYELCQQAAIDESAVYANTDCVIVPGCPRQGASCPPECWRRAGIASSVKGAGAYDIVQYCVYACGDAVTIPYRNPIGDQGKPRRYGYAPLPERQFFREWLV